MNGQENGGTALAQVPESGALSVEMKSQRDAALARPRNEESVFAAAMKELAAFPQFAEEAFYSIPFKDKDGKVALVEGPSVKASRALARRWGNCTTASRIVADLGDSYDVEGVFVDYETNFVTRRIVPVKKVYIAKATKLPVPLREDRLTMAVQAGMSKAERNAALAGLPVYLVEAYFAEAKRIAGQKGKKENLTVEQRFGILYDLFKKSFGIERERLQAFLDKTFAADANPDEVLGTLKGIYNALKDGQATVDDLLGEASAETKAGKGPVGADDLTGGAKK
jgi:hypothetical protein